MGKGLNSDKRSAYHRNFKDKARNRVDDLEGVFTNLQSARKESRTRDVALLEEQVQQMLREWKAELNEASPTNSLLEASRGSSALSSDIRRLLQLCEEDDDATSKLAPAPVSPKIEEYYIDHTQEVHDFQGVVDKLECSPAGGLQHAPGTDHMGTTTELAQFHFDLHQNFPEDICISFPAAGNQQVEECILDVPGINPPPEAFLGPKCALWDCPRPSQGSEWCPSYCSNFHASLALQEGPPGMKPVLRPGGIDLKDGPLFAALCAKTQGKDVGIPECEGAATTKSPWNAPELFDLSVLEGETLREWLFFDKPRRAFESGNRKQRSLPDYSGRGWHESRKQVMKDFGGLKRSYYMDPQPVGQFEWHLYEYELNNCDAWALYRLELKTVNGKKNSKVKVNADPLLDLQQQMGRLSAEFPLESKKSVKPRLKNTDHVSVANTHLVSNQSTPVYEGYGYEANYQFAYYVSVGASVLKDKR
ncbi:unnamed protein product [Victoria cruziana]